MHFQHFILSKLLLSSYDYGMNAVLLGMIIADMEVNYQVLL